jgi:hypothetical protein
MNKNFNLDNYETVKERKKKFKSDFPDGRIIVELIHGNEDNTIIKANIFKNLEEQEKNLPLSTGYAQEFKGQGGFANKYAWLENCEESAVGRALDNAGYAGNDKCSQEEMKKVKNHEEVSENKLKPKRSFKKRQQNKEEIGENENDEL